METEVKSPWITLLGFFAINIFAFAIKLFISRMWYPISYFESFGILMLGLAIVSILMEFIIHWKK